MDKLTKDQKDEYATSLAAIALYDGGADVTSDQINTLLEATGNTEVAAFYPIIFAKFLTPEKISQIIISPVSGGGGGGGSGGGAGGGGEEGGAGGESKAAEIEEVEEAPPAVDSKSWCSILLFFKARPETLWLFVGLLSLSTFRKGGMHCIQFFWIIFPFYSTHSSPLSSVYL
jgi:large subunit ribosomal protein LP1